MFAASVGWMQIDSVPLTADNVTLCAPLWGGRETYRQGELARVLAAASTLLRQHRAVGAVIREDEVVRGFGLTTFADEALVESYLEDPHPHIGRRLLLEAADPRSRSVLAIDQIAARNAGGGLQLVVVNTAYDPAASDPDMVLGRMIGAFHETHRGYRLARIVNEVFGGAAMSADATARSYDVRCVFELDTPAGPLRSLVGTLTREQAARWRHPFLAMFAYSPPRLMFTRAEQELLAEALVGATDETLGERLDIPLSAVKARWSRIHGRFARFAPELLHHVALPDHGRGVQTRHLILHYIRQHPSELTPYAVERAPVDAGVTRP
jgi:hypothetical protein